KASALRLSNGGVIRRKNNKSYVVTWPTGEQVMIDFRRSGSFDFMNINVEVPTCNAGEYTGLLGNANGRRNDDLDLSSGRLNDIGFTASDSDVFGGLGRTQREKEREYLRYIARDYASVYRVNMVTSLFDYGLGQNTATFTDLLFPRQHRSVSDIPQGRRNRARRRCLEQGIAPENMNACIFDVAFVNIDPEPRRRIPRATDGVDFTPTPNSGRRPSSTLGPNQTPSSNTGRIPGTNPNGNVDGEVQGGTTLTGGEAIKAPVKLDSSFGGDKPQTIVRPESEVPTRNENPQSITTEKKPTKVVPVVKPVEETVKKPVPQPKPVVKPVPQPKEVRKPARKITTPPKTAPKPTPTVIAPKKPRVTPKPKPRPTTPKVVPRPKPTPRPAPKPRATPKPRPVVKPVPKVTPKRTPTPKPVVRPSRR
ncbi:MAG: hypothetical protein R3333_07925, partial [Lishizhenia sp.]|nr:hypothetical protein [Lishizhenia sp.]